MLEYKCWPVPIGIQLILQGFACWIIHHLLGTRKVSYFRVFFRSPFPIAAKNRLFDGTLSTREKRSKFLLFFSGLQKIRPCLHWTSFMHPIGPERRFFLLFLCKPVRWFQLPCPYKKVNGTTADTVEKHSSADQATPVRVPLTFLCRHGTWNHFITTVKGPLELLHSIRMPSDDLGVSSKCDLRCCLASGIIGRLLFEGWNICPRYIINNPAKRFSSQGGIKLFLFNVLAVSWLLFDDSGNQGCFHLTTDFVCLAEWPISLSVSINNHTSFLTIRKWMKRAKGSISVSCCEVFWKINQFSTDF